MLRSLHIFIILLIVTGNYCQQKPEVQYGVSFFGDGYPRYISSIDSMDAGDVFECRGVYTFLFVQSKPLPSLLSLESPAHLEYIILADSLNEQQGTLISLTGVVTTIDVYYAPDIRIPFKVLSVKEIHSKKDYALFLEKTRKRYKSYKPEIIDYYRKHNIDLNLPSQNNWRSVVDEKAGRIVVYTVIDRIQERTVIDFVYTITGKKLITVHSQSSFKGES